MPSTSSTRARNVTRRTGFLLAAVVSTTLLAGCERYALDRQMEQLCKKDGGVKVYEQIRLPATEFDKDGIPFPKYWRSQPLIGTEGRLGPAYRYLLRQSVLKDGEPEAGSGRLLRLSEEVYRVSDGKLLGASIAYIRQGGDLVAIGHPTSNSCPVNRTALIKQIFVLKK